MFGVYCEQVTKLQGRRELRQSAIDPGGDLVVLSARRLVRKSGSVLGVIVVSMGCVENSGVNYRPEFSYS
jgi:hypothetical protein